MSESSISNTKTSPPLHVIMIAAYISILPFICYVDSTRLGLSSDHETLSSPSRHSAVDSYMLDTSRPFPPITDTKSIEDQKTYQRNNFESLKTSEFLQNDIKDKVHFLSSSYAAALLSSSTLSVEELPKPHVEDQVATGATSVSKNKESKHNHKHQHHKKHHSKKRHHKVYRLKILIKLSPRARFGSLFHYSRGIHNKISFRHSQWTLLMKRIYKFTNSNILEC